MYEKCLLWEIVSQKKIKKNSYVFKTKEFYSEFQNVLGNTPNTAWDMMGYRGPVLAAEEAALRAAAAHAPELPGVDLRNPFI